MNFTLTKEQEIIRDSEGSLIIKACAGAGKTSSFIIKAENHPDKKFLYLCFNKSIQREAQLKFPKNTDCKTVHSLAYNKVARKYTLSKYGYSVYDIKDLLNIPDGDDYWGYKVAYLIRNKFSLYCNLDIKNIHDLDMNLYITNPDTQVLYDQEKVLIDDGAFRMWDMMDKKVIDINHDFYVKKYSLVAKDLGYDYILVDEAQDISPCFIDIIKAQNGNKIICGDFSQAIYGWRSGVGDFAKYFPDVKHTTLSHSFRFKQDVASLCNRILKTKETYLGINDGLEVIGSGQNNSLKTKAVISRTNSKLLSEVLNYLGMVDKIYIEGGLSSILRADGFSVYDLLSLFCNKRDKINSKFIKTFKTFEHLQIYSETVGASELNCLLGLVGFYQTKLYQHINDINSKLTEIKGEADLIFSTVHKSKGLEYDIVELADGDFVSEHGILGEYNDTSKGYDGISDQRKPRISEEINLLYVAASRAKNKLIFPDYLIDSASRYLEESFESSMSGHLLFSGF